MINLPKIRRTSWLFSCILFLLASVFAIACTPQQPEAPSLKVISVGHAPWPGFSAHYVAVGKDLFKAEGLVVKDTPLPQQADADSSFLAKRLDIDWIGLPNALTLIETDPDIKIVFQCDYSNGGDGIVARNIKNKESLKGQRIARESSVFAEAELETYLTKMGLTRSDITILDLTAAEAAEAFIKGQVNVAITYEPWLTKAAKEGKGEIVFSTKDTNLIPDGVLVREDLIQNHKPELLAYLRAIEKATQLIKEKPTEVTDIIAKALGIKPEEVASQLALAKLYDLKMNQSISFNQTNPNSLYESLKYNLKVARDSKLIKKDIDIKAALRDDIVKSIP
jgi:NitT/TauT family transport system substrate-binding protein